MIRFTALTLKTATSSARAAKSRQTKGASRNEKPFDRSSEEFADEEERVDSITAGRPDYGDMTLEERIQARRDADQTFRNETNGNGLRWQHTRDRAVELIEAGQ